MDVGQSYTTRVDFVGLGKAVHATCGIENCVLEIIREENALYEINKGVQDLCEKGWKFHKYPLIAPRYGSPEARNGPRCKLQLQRADGDASPLTEVHSDQHSPTF